MRSGASNHYYLPTSNMTSNIVPVLTRNDISIEFTKDRPISLTAIWKMEGSPDNKQPYEWKRLPDTKKLIKRIEIEVKGGKSRNGTGSEFEAVIKSERGGNNPETKAHWKLALEYAAYLNIETKSWMLGIIGDYIAEPEELAVEAFERIQDPKKIAATKARIDGIAARKLETNAFDATGLVTEGYQYGILTNATYQGLLGADAKTLKSQMGLKPKDSLRDNLDEVSLIAIALSEALAARKASEAQNFGQLRSIVLEQALKVGQAIV
jgi:hypothetical protein